MDTLTSVVAILAVLSLSVENIVEILKTIPKLDRWLVKKEQEADQSNEDYRIAENSRRMRHHVLAILVGTGLAWVSFDVLSPVLDRALGIQTASGIGKLGLSALLGLMASGGSSFWNSSMRLIQEAKKAREEMADAARRGRAPA